MCWLQIDIADVGSEVTVWSVFGQSHDVPNIGITNKDIIASVNDPRHRSFGHRLLLPSSIHGMCPTLVQFIFRLEKRLELF